MDEPKGDAPEQWLQTQTPKRAKSLPKDLVYSAHLGNNAEQFPGIMQLYVKPGSAVLDATYGKGVFWRHVPADRYKLTASDLQTGVDFRALPYEDKSFDCVILDPPYMHPSGGTAHAGQDAFEDAYQNNALVQQGPNDATSAGHPAVLELYQKGMAEAYRVLKPKGILIVKGQDEVWSGRQCLTHVELVNHATETRQFVVEDYMILMSPKRPNISRMNQQKHARKNHSWWLVFRKTNKPAV